jgi:BirA family biotin operon repressor/biotin-[acetyl-CoA-carboxylase] ligase
VLVDDRAPLDPDRLVTPVDWSVEIVDATPSTNALVAERARSGAAGEGLVVVAEHQTAGRGRLDRTWETPPRAALTASLLLSPRVAPAEWPWLPLLVGYAAGRALRQLGAAGVGLKWPNDVLLGDLKVGGILTERVDTPTGAALVAGIGLNVDQTREELPFEGATSLALEEVAVDRTELLGALLRSLRTEYDALARGELAALRSAYAASCVTLGREVRVELPAGETLTGEATGIDEGGRLLVDTGGRVVPVSAGDVVHARLA